MSRLVVILCLFLVSCVSNKKIAAELNSWVGSNKQQLIQTWGPPAQTTSDGGTGEILVYARRVYYQLGTNPVDYWEYRMMYADKSGTIYQWLYRKNPNPPERVDVRLLK
jgi:hypothetical protein